MLKILINAMEIDFDGTITLRLLNPMFSDEMSHSFNCKTVNTARNKDVIEQLHLPETGYNKIQFPGMIVTDGFTLMGAIYIISPTDKYLDFQFNSQNDFWNTADVSLRSLDLPFDARYLPIKNSKFMDAFPISGAYNGFVIKNEGELTIDITHLGKYTGFVNAIDTHGDPVTDITTPPVPFMRLNGVIEGILNNFKINIAQNDLSSNADLEQLYLYNSNSNGNYRYRKASERIINSTEFTRCQVTIENGVYKLNAKNGHSFADGSYIMVTEAYIRPLESQNQFLNKVFKVTVEDEHFISFDITPVVSALTDVPRTMEDYYIYATKPMRDGLIEEKSKNHLPEINCGEFLHEVEKLTGSKVFVDESSRSCRILSLKNILKTNEIEDVSEYAGEVTNQAMTKQEGYKLSFTDPGEDEYYSARVKEITDVMTRKDDFPTDYSVPLLGNKVNDIRLNQFDQSFYRYYEINFIQSAGWEFFSENFLKLQEGEGKFPINTKFSPLLVERALFKTDMAWPRCDKEGKFLIMGQGDHEDFRLFFYRGTYAMQVYYTNHFETELWPMCTNDVYDKAHVKIPEANLALRWDGEYGLYNTFYKEWIDLMVNHYREETRFIDWPKWMLNSFAWWKKYRINHMNYLVKSIDLELTASGTTIKDTILVAV